MNDSKNMSVFRMGSSTFSLLIPSTFSTAESWEVVRAGGVSCFTVEEMEDLMSCTRHPKWQMQSRFLKCPPR